MTKTYRVTSETVNFSLIVPDTTTADEVRAEVRETATTILQQQTQLIQSGKWQGQVSRVDEAEEEDASTMLGRLCAEYYRSQQS